MKTVKPKNILFYDEAFEKLIGSYVNRGFTRDEVVEVADYHINRLMRLNELLRADGDWFIGKTINVSNRSWQVLNSNLKGTYKVVKRDGIQFFIEREGDDTQYVTDRETLAYLLSGDVEVKFLYVGVWGDYTSIVI